MVSSQSMSDALKLLVLFAVLAVITIAVFVVIARSTRRATDDFEAVAHGLHLVRYRWFIGVLLALLAVFVATIPFFPYEPFAEAFVPAQKVPVAAAQFLFIMPDHFPVNERIVFEVTSRDVNHGFGIYDPDGHLIAQVQAMPDYINYLPVTFHKPGHYKVLCLEYCGVGHPVMAKDFTVGDEQ